MSSTTIEAASKEIDSKEDDLAFVAGATGRVGSRTVRLLCGIQYSRWLRMLDYQFALIVNILRKFFFSP